MQNDEGWLTHLFAGVESQSEIPSANHLHLKGKAKAVTPSLIYYYPRLYITNAGFAPREETTRALRMLDEVYGLLYEVAKR